VLWPSLTEGQIIEREIIMWYRFSIAATVLMLGVAGAAAAELPTYEAMGFPITPHQVSVVGSAHVQERAPIPALTVVGMPASPHQIAVLTPRPRMIEEQIVKVLDRRE
jgi:hypothetical protein